jgi:hypothetical protein
MTQPAPIRDQHGNIVLELRADMQDGTNKPRMWCSQGCGHVAFQGEETCGHPDCNYNYLVSNGHIPSTPDFLPSLEARDCKNGIVQNGPTGQTFIARDGQWKRIG